MIENSNRTTYKNRSEVYDFIMSLPKANYQKDGLAIQKALRNEWQGESFESGDIYFNSIDVKMAIDDIYQSIFLNRSNNG